MIADTDFYESVRAIQLSSTQLASAMNLVLIARNAVTTASLQDIHMPFAFGEGSSMLDSKVRKDSKVFMQPGATYVKDCVTGISNQGRSNGLLINTRSGAVLKPDIIVLCTGFKVSSSLHGRNSTRPTVVGHCCSFGVS